MKKIILSLLVVFMSLPAMAADETIDISGTVRDETETLINASISYTSANGTLIGTITDMDGKFTLKDVPSNATITISYVGCTEQKYTASSIPSTFKLNCENILNEVVVKACAPDKANGIAVRELIDDECYPTKCIEPRWKLSGSGKSAKCVEQKCTFDNGTGEWAQNDDTWECKLTSCNTDKGYKKSTDETQCVKMLQKCTDEQLKEHPNASDTGIKAGTEICIATACKCGYKLDGEKCVAIPENTPCDKDDLPKYASAGIKACKNGKPYCKITACLNETEYTLDTEKNRCEYLKGETCTHTDTNAERAEWKKDDNGKLVCTLKKCKDGFYVVDNKCEPSDGDCTAEQLKQIEHAIKGARNKDKCVPTECEPGFEPSGNECVDIAGKCKTKPEHSKKSHREFVSGAEICKIDECEDGYRISSDGQKCEPNLTEQQARDKAKELRANADEMKRVEQSTENKLLGAAGMGAAGIGGMQVASALAEKNADEDAERDMAAYLATFRCDYGHGLNIKGGETGIELPGANSLIPLYQEYVNLANDLKVRKNALGMKPGIESEKILDAATSGLYDNQSIGKVDGAFTSLARALADPTGADAAEWAAQKDATAKKLKTGAVVAGIGILGSAVGNAIINRNVNERSDEIIRNYQPLKNLEQKINQIPEQKTSCPTDATGTSVPDCTCKDTSKFYNDNTNTCEACAHNGEIVKDNQCQCAIAGQIVDGGACKCPGNQIVNGDKCACPSDKPDWDGATQTCVAKKTEPETCEYKCAEPTSNNHLVRNNDAKCTCGCNNGYTYNETSHTCECVGENMKEENGQCTKVVVKTETKVEEVLQVVQNTTTTITLDAGSLFDIGKSTLRPEAQVELTNFLNNDMAGKSECELTIIGYTDPVGSIQTNQKLSMDRATSVKNYLQSNDTNRLLTSITAQGLGENNCSCGVGKGKIPSGQEKSRDYVACYGKDATYPITGDQRFAPCRRVEIQAKCIEKNSESSTEAVKKN